MSEIVVTGALGYLGCAVVAGLRQAGHDVVGFDSGDNARLDGLGGVPIADVDVTDEAAVFAGLGTAGPDVVVHLAGVPGVDDCEAHPVAAAAVNVTGTQHVAHWCRANDVPLVLASTAGVYGPKTTMPLRPGRPRQPPHFYGRTKRAAEDVLEAAATSTAPMVALEMTNLYGQYEVGGETVQKPVAANFFVERALAGEPIPVHEPGWQVRDFLHVLDASEAYVDVVGTLALPEIEGFHRLLVGGDDEWPIGELADRIAERTGADVEMVENPSSGPFYQAFDVDLSSTLAFCGWTPSRSLGSLVDAEIRAATAD